MTDQDLIRRCGEGEEAAYEELFNRYEPRALRLAFALTGDRHEAEDAKQEGFVQAFKALPRLEPGREFGPWLYRAVVWAARNRANRARRWREAIARAVALAGSARQRDEADDVDVRGALVDALRDLPADQREVVVLRFYLDLSEAEVAAVIGRPVGTVKSRTARGLQRLASSPMLAWHASKLERRANV